MEILPYPKFTFFPLAIVFSEVRCPGDVYIVLGETEHKNKKQTNKITKTVATRWRSQKEACTVCYGCIVNEEISSDREETYDWEEG